MIDLIEIMKESQIKDFIAEAKDSDEKNRRIPLMTSPSIPGYKDALKLYLEYVIKNDVPENHRVIGFLLGYMVVEKVK